MSRETQSRDGLTAGVLAAAVHGFFVLLLVVGVSWQIHDPQPIMADLWQSLPEPARAVPEPAPAPQARPQPAPKPAPAPPPPQAKPQPEPDDRAAEIAMEKKKRREAEELKRKQALEAERKKREEEKRLAQEQERQKLAEAKRRAELQRQEEELQQQLLAQSLAAESSQLKARAAAAQRASEIDKLVARYQDLISAKIRENTRLPENLAGNPQVEFRLSVLPTGDIAKVTLTKSSGNPAFDQAVLRGIEKSSPLPLPADRTAMERFRDLQIKHKARE